MIIAKDIKQKLLEGGAWVFGGKVATVCLGLVTHALLARLLPIEEFGAYFLLLSAVNVAVMLAQLGLNQTVVRFISEALAVRAFDRAARVLGLAICFCVCGAIVVASLFAFLGGQWVAKVVFSSPPMAATTGIASLWIVTLALQQLFAESFRGLHDIRFATVFGGLITSVLVVGALLLLWFSGCRVSLHTVVSLCVVASGVSALMAGILILRRLPLRLATQKPSAGEVWHVAWPLLGTSLMLFVLTQVDIWILGAVRGADEVAVYGAATRLMSLVSMPLLIVNGVVPPIIAQMYTQRKTAELEHILRTTATFAGVPSLIVLVIFIFWGGDVLSMVYGPSFSQATGILLFLSVGQMVNVWAGSCGLTLMMTGHQIEILVITLLTGFVTTIMALITVQPWGGLGVAGSAMGGMILQNLAMLGMTYRRVGIRTNMSFVLR
ncbi:O-antigen/teichoic acid export membrane protein [Geothermobacter ehrlichii]|uniref:O-antigen/teichoic acid export membrane protein n=1 Tax=Geothermobacter ehrlichii TaxID=213224 RepID=A0A5D3WGN2_9BACT|nr:oligosaccharide flippase family protein [Geothermobacter ehrlichii]TYO96057.1 O-antigen/teichoic acid export membrane protein [Geothermobacter ehrlichii]